MKKWFVYIVKCKDSSLYTGITTDVKRRLLEHNNKQGAKALLGKLPVDLVYKEEYKNRVEAAKREREIKGWNRKKKDNLVRG
jgi:putative endonuclease